MSYHNLGPFSAIVRLLENGWLATTVGRVGRWRMAKRPADMLVSCEYPKGNKQSRTKLPAQPMCVRQAQTYLCPGNKAAVLYRTLSSQAIPEYKPLCAGSSL